MPAAFDLVMLNLSLALILITLLTISVILWIVVKAFRHVSRKIFCHLEDRWYLLSVKTAAGNWGRFVSSASYYSKTVRLDRLATKHMSVDEMEAMATVLQKRLHPDSVVQVSEIRWEEIRIDFYQNNGGVPFVWVNLAPLESSFPRPVASVVSGNLRDWKMLPINP